MNVVKLVATCMSNVEQDLQLLLLLYFFNTLCYIWQGSRLVSGKEVSKLYIIREYSGREVVFEDSQLNISGLL